MKDLGKCHKKLQKHLDKERYEHTLGVMYTAAALAMAYHYDMDKAMTAGLLHDCAKNVPNEKKLELCKKHHIEVTETEHENPVLLHAKVGAYLAKKKYDVEDEEILHAIKVHTTGEPGMNTLDMILFIADYIEPGRDKAQNLKQIREMAFQSLERTVEQILYDTLHYLNERSGRIDPTTELTYEYFKNRREEQDEYNK
ncbi:MAG: bis(5'-nucleosyl)-tetraphosphatase (symmetrical) YqeK [Eubacterium sp.]|nr:bis(5'-nucleosyl)-tetraphosphatase (symmetrical) YqeK [Eubacterium sp.]